MNWWKMLSAMGRKPESGSESDTPLADTWVSCRFGAVLVEDKFESILDKVLAADGG